VILEAAVLTAVVVVSLTLYTFWAAKRGYDFNFLGPFLFASLMALIVFGFIQVRYFVYSLFLLFVQYIIR
jgi:protein lifeguard